MNKKTKKEIIKCFFFELFCLWAIYFSLTLFKNTTEIITSSYVILFWSIGNLVFRLFIIK